MEFVHPQYYCSSATFHFHSEPRDPNFFLEDHQKPWGNGDRFLKRTMAGKDGDSESTPRIAGLGAGGRGQGVANLILWKRHLTFGAFCWDVRTLTFCQLMGFPLNR